MHTLEHGHTHEHDPHEVPLKVLLSHMAEHNESHVAELEHLAHHTGGDISGQILKAVELLRQGNEELKKALSMTKE